MSSITLSVAISFCTPAARYSAAAVGRWGSSRRRCLRSRGNAPHNTVCFCEVYAQSLKDQDKMCCKWWAWADDRMHSPSLGWVAYCDGARPCSLSSFFQQSCVGSHCTWKDPFTLPVCKYEERAIREDGENADSCSTFKHSIRLEERRESFLLLLYLFYLFWFFFLPSGQQQPPRPPFFVLQDINRFPTRCFRWQPSVNLRVWTSPNTSLLRQTGSSCSLFSSHSQLCSLECDKTKSCVKLSPWITGVMQKPFLQAGPFATVL